MKENTVKGSVVEEVKTKIRGSKRFSETAENAPLENNGDEDSKAEAVASAAPAAPAAPQAEEAAEEAAAPQAEEAAESEELADDVEVEAAETMASEEAAPEQEAVEDASEVTRLKVLDRLEPWKEQIQNHYIASLIYKDLETNLADRNSMVTEFQSQISDLKAQIKELLDNQSNLKSQVESLANKQQDCLKEYQAGAQELDQEVAEINRQISELEKRKSEIAEQHEMRLKDQDATQNQLQNEIDQLEKEQAACQEKQQQIEEDVAKLAAPEKLVSLESRITDLVHHICTIFAPANVDHPSAEVAFRDTSPGIVMPPIFQLEPWAAEENKGLTHLNLPVGAKQVILSLHMPGEMSYEHYGAELYASNGRRVWDNEKLEANGRAVVITFNSTFFLSDDYELRLRGRNSERKYSSIAEYYFHISKN